MSWHTKQVALSLLIISMMPFMLHFCFNQIGISAPVRYNMAVFKNLGLMIIGEYRNGISQGDMYIGYNLILREWDDCGKLYYTILTWLVVWNMNFMTFHILGRIIPTDFHSMIFQRGWNHQPVTNGMIVGNYTTLYILENHNPLNHWGNPVLNQ